MPPEKEVREDVLMEHHSQLAAIRQGQTDINRRLGSLEKRMDAFLDMLPQAVLLENRVKALEESEGAEEAGKKEWVTWVIQIVLGSILVALGSHFGVEVFAP